jgi:hypothetical protein
MNIRRVKQGAKITMFSGIYQIALGFYYLLFIDFNMKMNFDSISKLWGFFSKYSSDIANQFYLYNILVGIFLMIIGTFVIYLSYNLLIRKERITWVILFLSGIVTWVGLLTISILLKNVLLIVLSFFGWSLFVIGMILPIGYYLESPYKEY